MSGRTTNSRDWQAAATALLRDRMRAAGVGVTELSRLLGQIGVQQSVTNVANKIANGSFSATFFLQVLIALRVEEVELGAPHDPRRVEGGPAAWGSNAEDAGREAET